MMNDADFMQRELEQAGNLESRLWKKGICTHGWRKGAPNGQLECNYCHKIASEWKLDLERKEILDEYR